MKNEEKRESQQTSMASTLVFTCIWAIVPFSYDKETLINGSETNMSRCHFMIKVLNELGLKS